MAERQRLKLFSANGDGSGAADMSVNGSVTPVIFKLSVPTGRDHTKVSRIEIFGEDAAVTDAEGTYLNLANVGPVELANGTHVAIFTEVGDVLVNDLLSSINEAFPAAGSAKNNADWRAVGWQYEEIGFTANDSMVIVFLDLSEDPLVINAGQYLGIVVNDDLTAFTNHTASYLSQDF